MEWLPVVIILIAVALAIWFATWKGNADKERVRQYLSEHDVSAEVLKAGIPPLRLWLRNRKGDGWVKILYVDGVEQWVRVRKILFGGWTYEFFD